MHDGIPMVVHRGEVVGVPRTHMQRVPTDTGGVAHAIGGQYSYAAVHLTGSHGIHTANRFAKRNKRLEM